MRAILLIALASSLLLSGCVGPSTALSLQSSAQNEAENTDADAILVGILGAEWTNESLADTFRSDSQEAEALDQGVDAMPGDGLANAWGFLFQTIDGAYLVIVGADGNVLDSKLLHEGSDMSENFGFSTPVGDVQIDSDEAATIVHENNEKFAGIVASDDAVVVMALAAHDDFDGTYWVFTAFSGEGEDFTIALVNALDGSYTDFSSIFG